MLGAIPASTGATAITGRFPVGPVQNVICTQRRLVSTRKVSMDGAISVVPSLATWLIRSVMR
jgi:hypothetical protein